MAQKRMFSLKIIDADAFLEMPQSSQLLYFHLAMRADDDGFVSNPKKIIRMTGSGEDDFKILIAKRFLLVFESGICVIKHWRIHNYIQNDRYIETTYIDEKKRLKIKENGSYTECIQNVSKMDTQIRLDKIRLDKISIDKERGDKSPTPAQIARDFFNNQEKQEEIIQDLVIKGAPEEIVRKEINKFCSYWTEKNKSGTKERWEIEKTFEIRRRLATWFGNVKNFSRSHNNQQREILSTT